MELNGKSRPKSLWGWVVLGVLGVASAGGAAYYFAVGPGAARAKEQENLPRARGALVAVVHPTMGQAARTSTQPGSIHSFEWAQLFSNVPGYLAEQRVDIGDRVTKDQILAKIAVPELEKKVEQQAASLAQAKAHILQAEASVASARADVKTAEAGIVQAKANSKSALARREFREKQYKRLKALYATGSIEEKVVDESLDQSTAAFEHYNAAEAAIATSKAQKISADAKVMQAEADVAEAKAKVGVLQAELDKAKVMVQYATITSPYTGVITQRSMHRGDFVRAASESSIEPPLLTVERTDKVRVVVQIPDRDVPYVEPGDAATVEIDALPDRKLQGKVSRISHSEDPNTRLMRVEVDLPNPDRKLKQGMYGRVTIVLDRGAELLSVPSSCVVTRSDNDKASVFVVRDGHAHLLNVQIGQDNGLRVAVIKGLTLKDAVIDNPPHDLTDGAPVRVEATH